MDSYSFVLKYLAKKSPIILVSLLIIVLAGCSVGSSGNPTPPAGSDLPVADASIVLESALVKQYGELNFTLSGFQPLEEVTINVVGDGLGTNEPIAQIVVDNDGSSASETVSLPEWVTSGTRTIQAGGEKSGRQADETLYVQAQELWIELANFAIKPTEKLGFVGGGFEPEEKVNVFLYHQSQQRPTEPLLTISTDEAGNFPWTEINTPPSPTGEYTLLLASTQSTPDRPREEARGVILVPLSPELSLEPYAGIPGTKLTFSGQGFLAGERIHVFLGGKENEISSFLADEYGNFWSAGTYGVPLDANAGVSSIVVTGEQSGVSISRPFTVLRTEPWLELSNYAGASGSSIRFSGGGFAAGEKITIRSETRENPPIATGVTNEEGKFWDVGPAAVPPSQNDKVTFIVVGEGSHTEAQASFQLLSRSTPPH